MTQNYDMMDLDNARKLEARNEFIREQGIDVWPTHYLNLIPVTELRSEFVKYMKIVAAKMAEDYAAYRADLESPWVRVGPYASLVKNDGLSGTELMTVGLKLERMLGMPAPVKNGVAPDGIAYHDHPEVVEAQANAHRTAEYVAQMREQILMREWTAASRAYTAASNAEAQKAFDKAKAEVARLRANPKLGLKIVREALTEDAQIEENQKAYGK